MPNCPPADDVFFKKLDLAYMQILDRDDIANLSNFGSWDGYSLNYCESPLVFGKWGEVAASNLTSYQTEEYDDVYFFTASKFSKKLEQEYLRFDPLIPQNSILSKGLDIISNFTLNKVSKIYSEITDDNSILVSGYFNDKKIFFELFLTNPSDDYLIEEAVINIYENSENVFCNAGSITDIFLKMQEYLEEAKGFDESETSYYPESTLSDEASTSYAIQDY